MQNHAESEARPGDGVQAHTGIDEVVAVNVPEEPEATGPAAKDPFVHVRREGEILVVALDPAAPFEVVRDEIRRLFKHRRAPDPALGSGEPGDSDGTEDECTPGDDTGPADADEAPVGDGESEAEGPLADGVTAAGGGPAADDEDRVELPEEPEELDGIPSRSARPALAVRLDLASRPVDTFDIRSLVHLLKDEFQVAVTGIFCTSAALHRFAQQELKLHVITREPRPARHVITECEGPVALEPEPILRPRKEQPERPKPREAAAEGGRKLLVVDKTMRSGHVVKYGGDVIVFGDVNAGAILEAAGNIYVLGSLRGLAHAGAPADEKAIIMAFDLRPTQLRIGQQIGYPPARETKDGGSRLGALFGLARSEPEGSRTEIAYVRDGEITLEEYRGQLPA